MHCLEVVSFVTLYCVLIYLVLLFFFRNVLDGVLQLYHCGLVTEGVDGVDVANKFNQSDHSFPKPIRFRTDGRAATH